MNHGWRKALALREIYCPLGGTPSDDELDGLLADLGLRVLNVELPAGIKEALTGELVFLDRHLSVPWRRWLKVHAVGHLMLHRGNQFQLNFGTRLQQEHQAEQFAGWFLLADLVQSNLHSCLTPEWLANEANIPDECAARWWHSQAILVSGVGDVQMLPSLDWPRPRVKQARGVLS